MRSERITGDGGRQICSKVTGMPSLREILSMSSSRRRPKFERERIQHLLDGLLPVDMREGLAQVLDRIDAAAAALAHLSGQDPISGRFLAVELARRRLGEEARRHEFDA